MSFNSFVELSSLSSGHLNIDLRETAADYCQGALREAQLLHIFRLRSPRLKIWYRIPIFAAEDRAESTGFAFHTRARDGCVRRQRAGGPPIFGKLALDELFTMRGAVWAVHTKFVGESLSTG